MEFRILGPLDVVEQGRPIELGRGKQRSLLAILILHANEVVSSERLVDELWGERPPATAAKSVQVYVSQLRKAFVQDARSPAADGVLLTRGSGYVLQAGPGEIDAREFERLVTEGRRALEEGMPEVAAARLGEGLALFRGAPLADFAYEPFAQAEIARLQDARLAALEDRLEADLQLGRHAEVTGELEALSAEHPLRERLAGQLMLALYRSGRQAEALDAYGRARRRLSDELGLEPGPELRELQAAILAQDPQLAAPSRRPKATRPAAPARTPRPAAAPGRRRWALLGLGAAVVTGVVLAIVLAGGDTHLRTLPANAVGIVDAGSGTVVGDVPVGAGPGDIAVGRDALWVANVDDDTVARIDPRTGKVVRTVAVDEDLKGLAARGDTVWAVAGGGAERIDPGFNTVAGRVRLQRVRGVLPEGPAAVGDGAFLVSTGSSAIARLDPLTGRRIGRPAEVGNLPSAIAEGGGATWVTDGLDDTLVRVDPTGVVSVVQVGHGPRDVAVGAGGVWVANSQDDTVTRLDLHGRVRTTIAVGDEPHGIAVGAGAVWVANAGDGTLSRIDPGADRVSATISVGASPEDLVVAGGRVWVTLRAAAPPARLVPGGTIRVSLPRDPGPVDPTQIGASLDVADLVQELEPTCAKLLAHPDRPAPEGTRLRPEVARAMPRVSDGGRRYTFEVRPGFRFAPPSGAPVTAAAFARAFERVLHPSSPAFAAEFMDDIVGAPAYIAGRARRLAGVTARGNRLTIRLVRPSPSLPVRVATPYFCAVPSGTPIGKRGLDVPSAGPYYVASHVRDRSLLLRRNPNYHGSRPHRPAAIAYRYGTSRERAVSDVLAGRTDYVPEPPLSAHAGLSARFGPESPAARARRQQYFVNPDISVWYLVFNTSRPLFADVRLRRAVNYALDRRALARSPSLNASGRPTDQYLPPGMPGFKDAAIYPLGGPDLPKARRLAHGTRARAVLYTCNASPCPENAERIKHELAPIGLDVDIRELGLGAFFAHLDRPGEPWDMGYLGWLVDFMDPSTFINAMFEPGTTAAGTGPGSGNFGGFHDPRLTPRIERVARLTGAERLRAYGALDADLARRAAPVAAIATGTLRDLFSARVGCQVYQPLYGMALNALCGRKPT